MSNHPWMLVGPWYRWGEPGVKASGRRSRPAIEKYVTSDFVNRFLAEPQRSVKYQDKDFVHEVVAGSRFSLSGTAYRKAEPECRKLFLDTHSRFYLVVAELHCDAAGFPSVDRDQVCEAGMVVRRRKPRVAPEIFDDFVALLEKNAQNRAKILGLRGVSRARRPGSFERIRAALEGDRDARTAKLLAEHAQGLAELESFATEHGVRLAHQGWIPSEHQGVGSWVDVDETPQALTEAVYPLYPLIPDSEDQGHSARRRTVYFGVVPTFSSDTDELGNPCYDDHSLYQIRCFVRRHKEGCPKTSAPGDCSGELVWSRSTEKYRLAAPLDLDGTANRPVNIQLPDLAALEAQSEDFPSGANVRMQSPANSSLPFTLDGKDIPGMTSDGPGGAQICFFALPLITIVANFVLRLFLPILVLVFQLWFLLKLKLCIPPSLSLGGGANLDLAVAGTLGLAIDLDVDIDVDFMDEHLPGLTVADIDADLIKIVTEEFSGTMGTDLLAEFGLSPEGWVETDEALQTQHRNRLVKLLLDLSSDFSADAPPELAEHFDEFEPGPPASLPSVTAGIEYHDVLEVPT